MPSARPRWTYEISGLKSVPTDARALALRAVAHAQFDNFPDAIKDAEQSLLMDPHAGDKYDISLTELIPLWRRGVRNLRDAGR
jgi:hypothetical protein